LGKRLVFVRQDEWSAPRKKILGDVGDDLVLAGPAGRLDLSAMFPVLAPSVQIAVRDYRATFNGGAGARPRSLVCASQRRSWLLDRRQ
jgi:hypothetical protein